MDILKPLEEQFNKKFTGTTGYELREFILENMDDSKLEYHDEEYVRLTKNLSSIYILECNRAGLRLIKDYIVPTSIYANTTLYETFDEALASKKRSFEVKFQTDAQVKFRSLSKLLNYLKEVTKNTTIEYKLEIFSEDKGNDWKFVVQAGGFLRDSFKVFLNNYELMVVSYLELANRCADDTIKNYISTVLSSVDFINSVDLNDLFNY